tara:strand:- start:591 stop:1364 length:774 start_codon:yes stop_codon:yes gene_type:complete
MNQIQNTMKKIPFINMTSNKEISFTLDNIVSLVFILLCIGIVLFFTLHIDYKKNGRNIQYYDYLALFSGDIKNYYSKNIQSKAQELSEKKNEELVSILDSTEESINALEEEYESYRNKVKKTNNHLILNYETEKNNLQDKFDEFSKKLSILKVYMDKNNTETKNLYKTYVKRLKNYFNAMKTQLDNMSNVHIPAAEAIGKKGLYDNLVNLYNSIYEVLIQNITFIKSIHSGFDLKEHKQKQRKNIQTVEIESVNKQF